MINNPTTLLMSSVDNNDLENVKLAIENGANIHYKFDDALYSAVKNNNVEIFKYLIKNGLSFNENDNGYLIKIASTYGHLDIIKYMIEQDINIHYDNDLSLIYSFNNKHYDVFLYLLNHGADIDNCHVYANNKILEMKQYLRKQKLNKINLFI